MNHVLIKSSTDFGKGVGDDLVDENGIEIIAKVIDLCQSMTREIAYRLKKCTLVSLLFFSGVVQQKLP